jgi:CRISPR/Cas system-associated exonuclease Cas4 (RecB family)
MNNPHEMGFRPSHFPALSACIQNQQVAHAVEAALRGNNTHERIPKVLNAESIDYDQEEPPVQFAAAWTISRLMEGWRIVATELQVDILDGDGQSITGGTIDLLMERRGVYKVVDWKTGDKNGYTAQIAAYMSAVADLHPSFQDVEGEIVYLDLQETESVNLTTSECYYLVQDLWQKWNNKENEPYTINPYCDYCGLRGECPAWRAEGSKALSTVAELGVPTGSALVTAKVDALKNNPSRLEEFIVAWERAKTLVEGDWKLKDALKAHMENGFKADHHILVHVKDSTSIVRSIDPEQFLEKVARNIGFMNAAPAIKVDPDKAVEVWKTFYGYTDGAKFPVQIKETSVDKSGYSYVRQKGRTGAGEARKKRKELE